MPAEMPAERRQALVDLDKARKVWTFSHCEAQQMVATQRVVGGRGRKNEVGNGVSGGGFVCWHIRK